MYIIYVYCYILSRSIWDLHTEYVFHALVSTKMVKEACGKQAVSRR